MVAEQLVLDETAELKQGRMTVGVARQHAGITGQVELPDRGLRRVCDRPRPCPLRLPALPAQALVRRPRAAGAGFQTKTGQGTEMITAAISGGVPFSWIAGDEVYGRSSKLRAACEKDGKGYVLAVPVNFTVTLPSRRRLAVASLARLVPARCWEMRSCGPGCKGHRDYAWAWAATASPRHHVLIRRSISDPSDLAFFYCHTPAGQPVSLPALIMVAGKRWPVEEVSSRARAKPASTATRSGCGTPSTGTPCCPCARSRCSPSPQPAR